MLFYSKKKQNSNAFEAGISLPDNINVVGDNSSPSTSYKIIQAGSLINCQGYQKIRFMSLSDGGTSAVYYIDGNGVMGQVGSVSSGTGTYKDITNYDFLLVTNSKNSSVKVFLYNP